jgi:fibronectin-binding autotransporter adhesin
MLVAGDAVLFCHFAAWSPDALLWQSCSTSFMRVADVGCSMSRVNAARGLTRFKVKLLQDELAMRHCTCWMAALLVVALSATAAEAQLYWDRNGADAGATPGGSGDATGMWDDTTANWNPVSDGSGTTQLWDDVSAAVFAAGSDATGFYTVTVSGTQTAAGLTFEEGAVTLSGGTINLSANAVVNTSGQTATIGSVIGGTVGLTLSGNSFGQTYVLSGSNTYAGTTLLATNTNLGSFNWLQLGASEVIPNASDLRLEGQNSIIDMNGQTETVKSLGTVNTGAGALQNSRLDLGTGTLIIEDETGQTATWEAQVFASSTGKIIKNGAGLFTMTGSNSAWDGEFVLNSGEFRIGANNTLGTNAGTAKLTLNGGTIAASTTTANRTLQMNMVDIGGDFSFGGTGSAQMEFLGATETVNGVTEGAVDITLTNANPTINVSNANSILIFRGNVLENGNNYGLSKTGPGTLTMRHPNSTYGGATTILQGQVRVDADGALGNGSGALNLAGEGTSFNITQSRDVTMFPVPNPINVTANSAITTTQGAAATVDMNLTGNLTGSGGVTLSFRNDAAAGTNQFEPRLSGSGFSFASNIAIVAGLNAATRTTRLNLANASGTQTFSGVISGAGKLRRMTGGTSVLTGANTYSGGTEVEGGTLTASGASATFGISNITVSGGLLSIASGVLDAIDDAATLTVMTGGMVSLGTSVNDTIASLVLDGNTFGSGTYGHSTSGATNPGLANPDTYFAAGLGILTISSQGLPGDYNEDQVVDAADFVMWRKLFNPAGPALPNDDTPGVDNDDYDRWKTHFGETSAGSGGSNGTTSGQVPEPTSAILALLALAMVKAVRRRQA